MCTCSKSEQNSLFEFNSSCHNMFTKHKYWGGTKSLCCIHQEHPENFSFGHVSCRAFPVQLPSSLSMRYNVNRNVLTIVQPTCFTRSLRLSVLHFFYCPISHFCPIRIYAGSTVPMFRLQGACIWSGTRVFTISFVNLLLRAIAAPLRSVKPSKMEDASRAQALEAYLARDSCPKHAF